MFIIGPHSTLYTDMSGLSFDSHSNSDSEKVIAIGDIHGCARTLDALLNKLEAWPDHLLVFVRDYIDRGPRSREVVSRLITLQGERECVFLRGNHEEMLLNAIDKGEISLWIYNGGGATLQSYLLTRDSLTAFPEEHLEFIRQTELYYQTENYFLVHAGAPAGQTLAQSVEDPEARHTFLWGRNHINAPVTPWENIPVSSSRYLRSVRMSI